MLSLQGTKRSKSAIISFTVHIPTVQSEFKSYTFLPRELTIYCSETGKVVSRGDVSLQATCLTVDDALSSHPKLVAAHRRQVSFFDVL